jgi:hypothetical protein
VGHFLNVVPGPFSSVSYKENDYRRTLYWNPALSTDEQGKAYICFYNNSRCKYPRITVETLTEDGKIGVFRQ